MGRPVPIRAGVGASIPAGAGYAPAGAPKGFPRGKQSARRALPCVPLVVCLNSGSLTAFGGCAHWARASLRSPSPLRIANRNNRAPHRAASPSPAPESARQSPSKGNCLRQSCCPLMQAGGFPLAPCTPSGSRRVRPLPGITSSAEVSLCRASRVAFRSPPCTPFGPYSACRAGGMRLRAHQRAFLGANNRRGSHCRASRLLFA